MATLNPANAAGARPVRWLRLIEALRRIGATADPARAWDTLTSRLRTGTVRTRAAVLEHKIADDAPDVERDEQILEEMWGHLRNSSLMDAAAGVVELRGSMPDDNRPLRVTLHGLEIVEEDVSDLLGAEAVIGRAPGRPPAAFWMHFAEELAVFIHE